MCQCEGANQTHRDVFKFFKDKYAKAKNNDWVNNVHGAGLFLVPAPEIGILEYRKVLVENLSYAETIKRGANCKAFSFVPQDLMTTDQLRAKFCYGACPGPDCDNGCICSSYCR